MVIVNEVHLGEIKNKAFECPAKYFVYAKLKISMLSAVSETLIMYREFC